MKRTLLALTLGGLLSSTGALASNVEVYGVLDYGLTWQQNDAVDGTSVSIHVDGDIVITADARAPYMASSWWVVVMTVAVILLSLCIMSMPFKDDIVDWLHRNR